MFGAQCARNKENIVEELHESAIDIGRLLLVRYILTHKVNLIV